MVVVDNGVLVRDDGSGNFKDVISGAASSSPLPEYISLILLFERSGGKCARISCLRPAAVVVAGLVMPSWTSGMEAEKRMIKYICGVASGDDGEC